MPLMRSITKSKFLFNQANLNYLMFANIYLINKQTTMTKDRTQFTCAKKQTKKKYSFQVMNNKSDYNNRGVVASEELNKPICEREYEKEFTNDKTLIIVPTSIFAMAIPEENYLKVTGIIGKKSDDKNFNYGKYQFLNQEGKFMVWIDKDQKTVQANDALNEEANKQYRDKANLDIWNQTNGRIGCRHHGQIGPDCKECKKVCIRNGKEIKVIRGELK